MPCSKRFGSAFQGGKNALIVQMRVAVEASVLKGVPVFQLPRGGLGALSDFVTPENTHKML